MLQSSQQNRTKEVPGSRSQAEGPPAGGGARHRLGVGQTPSAGPSKVDRSPVLESPAQGGWRTEKMNSDSSRMGEGGQGWKVVSTVDLSEK